MAAEFQATTRLPFRPLSYEFIDLAYDKELIVDYEKGNLYLKDAHGKIIDLMKSISNLIIESGELNEHLTIVIPGTGGEGGDTTVSISEALLELITKVNNQQKIIDAITGSLPYDPEDPNDPNNPANPNYNPTIIIKPGQIVQDETHQFITNTQFTEISQKVSITDVVITIPASGWSGSGPYTQTVACTGAKTTMPRPTLDINHTDSETFENAKKADEAWCNIYRAKTNENTITLYATEKPTVDISAVVQLKITGLSANPEIKKS